MTPGYKNTLKTLLMHELFAAQKSMITQKVSDIIANASRAGKYPYFTYKGKEYSCFNSLANLNEIELEPNQLEAAEEICLLQKAYSVARQPIVNYIINALNRADNINECCYIFPECIQEIITSNSPFTISAEEANSSKLITFRQLHKEEEALVQAQLSKAMLLK